MTMITFSLTCLCILTSQERESNPILRLQDTVADSVEPLKRETARAAQKIPDPRDLVPSTLPNVSTARYILVTHVVCHPPSTANRPPPPHPPPPPRSGRRRWRWWWGSPSSPRWCRPARPSTPPASPPAASEPAHTYLHGTAAPSEPIRAAERRP